MEGKASKTTACLSAFLTPVSIEGESLSGPPTGNRPMPPGLCSAHCTTFAVVILAYSTHKLYRREKNKKNSYLHTIIRFSFWSAFTWFKSPTPFAVRLRAHPFCRNCALQQTDLPKICDSVVDREKPLDDGFKFLINNFAGLDS